MSAWVIVFDQATRLAKLDRQAIPPVRTFISKSNRDDCGRDGQDPETRKGGLMPEMLHKTDSGVDKQSINPKTWTYVRFDGKTSFKVSKVAIWNWLVILRIQYPTTGAPNVVRGRFARYPGTSKVDETGHDDKNVAGWSGKIYHSHWNHFFKTFPSMPIGFWIWHDGTKPIVLDGRQIKAETS
jgi:hypothetical protein